MLKTKKQLFLSILSLVLCIAMLLGTTYAWFTDSVTSGKNKIIAGNLDIEMYWTDDYEKAEAGTGEWYNVEDPEHNKVFDYDNWEPGYTELRYLKIKNGGNLAFKYKLGIGAAGAIGKLAEVIDVYYIPEVNANIDTRAKLFNVDEDNARPTVGTLKYILENQNNGTVNPEGKLLPADATTVPGGYDKGEVVVALAFKMQEEAGNEYQEESIGEGFYITAVATQLEYEEDSFDEYYDKDLSFPELKLPKNVSEKADLDDSNKVKADTELENGTSISATVPAGVEMEAGTKELVMTVKEVKKDEGNITADDTVISKTLDVHVEGVASGNTKPILVKIKNAVPSDMNRSAVVLYHTENGEKVKMTSKASLAEVTAHNDYHFDTYGNLTMALAHFSEILLKVDASNPWCGEVATDWYNDAGTTFAISTAEQLAGLAELVNGGKDFSGKTVVLDKSIVLNNWKVGETFYTPEELHSNNSPVYYPSNGANAQPNGGTNRDKPYYFTPIGTDEKPFKGTFNGDGHYISGLYRIHYGENDGYDNAYIGIFGCVDGATVKNLTVKDGFVESFGGLVGVVAATAKGNCTFDNIKIRNNYILTYNEYLGGVVGYYGAGTGTFKNISVDNTNNFGALWGTYDLPCGGIVGGVGSSTNIKLTDCNIFPSMDLYNDCCANYQWFNYRYSGMLVGYLPGSDIASFAQSHITCTNVSVHYGEWTSQYYCELRSLGKGSYNGETEWKYTKINRNAGAAGNCGHDHAANNAETTTWRGVEYGPNEAHEDHICVNMAFHQLFGGGQGVKGVEAHNGVQIVEKGSISVKFPNTDKYLYRVGSMNTVALGSLFEKAQNTPNNIDPNAIDIEAEPILGVTSVEYVKDASDWTKSTLKFSGTGVTGLTLYYADNAPVKLNLEVVNGYNVTTYSELANRNSVLLNDITMSSGGKYYLSNATLYGNGFTFDVTAGAHGDTEKGNESGNYVIGLLNANLDNVQVIGKVYTTYGGTTKADYNFPCVLVNGGDCVIANSYISNCASPIRARGGANLLLKNTTLKGGSFCNLDIRGGVDLTIDGLTTINQVNGNDAADNGTVIVGLGVVFWYEGANGSETITIKGDGIKQYNYVANDQKSYAVSIAQTAYDNVFSIDSKFKYNDGSRTWVNTGILSLYDAVGSDNINTPDGYEWYGVSMLGQSGHLCTQLASNFPGTVPPAAPGYQSNAQQAVAPSYSFEYPTASGKKNYLAKTEGSNDYCYWDSSRNSVLIGFEKGDTFSFDPDILTVTKNGEVLTPVITMKGVTYTGNITFTESGEYTVNYTYSDPYNFDENGEVSQSVEYTKTVNIITVAADKSIEPATFDFNGKGYKKVTGTNSVTYVMPNIDDSAVDGLNYVKKTVGGKTVYYPVVCVRNGSPSTTTSINGSALSKSSTNTALLMVFDGIVTITDNGNIYGSSNTNMADGKLSAVESGLASVLKWQSANSADTEPDVVSSKQCYKSASIQGVNRTQTGSDVEYIYTDDAGNEYHYFVKYVFPAKGTGTNAYYQANATFTVTVNCGANGTVDNTTIKGVKYGTALTSDLNKLKAGSSVIATATPNEKYAAQWSGLTSSVTKDTTVTLKFVKECTLTINCGAGGTVTTQTITGIAEGAKLTVDGNKLMVNGAVVATATPVSDGIANWSIPNTTVSDDMTVDLTFVTPVTITITAETNGSVSPTSVKVAPGKKLTSSGANLSYDGVVIATATPNKDYEVDKWNNVPTTAITANTTVSVSFKKSSSGCILPGTLITMADGTQKPVEEIVAGDMLLTWDLTTGDYGEKPVVFNDYEEAAECDVIYVTFSDGTEIGVISEHGFFNMDLGKYVYLDENAAQYLGHAFIKEDGSTVTLTNVEIKHEYTKYYSPTTFGDLCYYTNGMLSMPGGISGLFNIFEVDTDTMKYDEAKMQADIETYGLLDMDAFAGMITEDMFNAFNGKYLGIAVGKGNLTWEYIAYLAERYAPLCK